jgi:hypothetical protein
MASPLREIGFLNQEAVLAKTQRTRREARLYAAGANQAIFVKLNT